MTSAPEKSRPEPSSRQVCAKQMPRVMEPVRRRPDAVWLRTPSGVWLPHHAHAATLPQVYGLRPRRVPRVRELPVLRVPLPRFPPACALPPRVREPRKGRAIRFTLLFRQRTQNNPRRIPLRRGLRASGDWLRALFRGCGGRRRYIRLARRMRLARRDRAALHLLDDDRLRASMRKALAHNARLDRAFQCQRSGWSDAQRVTGVLAVIHQSCVPAHSVAARRKAGKFFDPHSRPAPRAGPAFPPRTIRIDKASTSGSVPKIP